MKESKLSRRQLQFIDKYTEFGQGIGLSRSAARVLGLLVISRPEHQTAENIHRELQLSTGSISIAVTTLMAMGLIERIRLQGDRKHYYRLAPDGFRLSLTRRLRTFTTAKDVAEFGLRINPGDSRLITMEKLFTFIDSEIQATAKKLEKLKKTS